MNSEDSVQDIFPKLAEEAIAGGSLHLEPIVPNSGNRLKSESLS
jgi:hypothetical protein